MSQTQVRTQQDVKNLGSILGIWAHPDDDVFSMGMIIAAAVRNGQDIACVIATRGEAGVQDESRWPAHKLMEIRTKELAEAYRMLGLDEHDCHWLDYPDGDCSWADQNEAVARIAGQIHRHQPDTILTFGPDGMTGHPDHQTVSRWASEAAKQAGSDAVIYHATNTPEQLKALKAPDERLDIFFNIDQPPVCPKDECDICLCNDEDLFRIKLEALRAMPSQTSKLMDLFEKDCRACFGIEAFVRWN